MHQGCVLLNYLQRILLVLPMHKNVLLVPEINELKLCTKKYCWFYKNTLKCTIGSKNQCIKVVY